MGRPRGRQPSRPAPAAASGTPTGPRPPTAPPSCRRPAPRARNASRRCRGGRRGRGWARGSARGCRHCRRCCSDGPCTRRTTPPPRPRHGRATTAATASTRGSRAAAGGPARCPRRIWKLTPSGWSRTLPPCRTASPGSAAAALHPRPRQSSLCAAGIVSHTPPTARPLNSPTPPCRPTHRRLWENSRGANGPPSRPSS